MERLWYSESEILIPLLEDWHQKLPFTGSMAMFYSTDSAVMSQLLSPTAGPTLPGTAKVWPATHKEAWYGRSAQQECSQRNQSGCLFQQSKFKLYGEGKQLKDTEKASSRSNEAVTYHTKIANEVKGFFPFFKGKSRV